MKHGKKTVILKKTKRNLLQWENIWSSMCRTNANPLSSSLEKKIVVANNRRIDMFKTANLFIHFDNLVNLFLVSWPTESSWPPIDHRHDIVDHMVLEQENTGDKCNLEVVDLGTSVTPFTEDYVADVKESCSTTEYFCHAR
jgi:hypothetical protein